MKNKFLISFVLLLLLCFANSCKDNTAPVQKISNQNDIKSLNNLAFYYENKHVWDSAFYYQNASRVIYLEHNDHKQAAIKLLAMANIQLVAGDYTGAENTTKEALPLLADDTVLLRKSYLLLAGTSKHLFNHSIAINYYNKAYSITKNTAHQLDIKHHIGCNYIKKGEYENATAVLKAALASPHAAKTPSVKASLLDHLGYTYFKQDNKEGINEMQEALKIRREANDLEGQFSSFIHVSEFYSDKSSKEASNFAKQAHGIAAQLNNPEFSLNALTRLINSTQGNELKEYLSEYMNTESELRKSRLNVKGKFDKILIESRKQEAEALRRSNEKERQLMMQISNGHNKLLLLSLIFTIFSSLLVYYLIRMRHKRERLMEGYITETRLAKKIHDEIGNEIYGTINYLSANSDIEPEKKENIIAKLDDIYLMTKNISRETNSIETGYQYPEHLKLMLSSYSGSDVNIIVKGITDIDWNVIDATKKIATYRSIQELMVNMRKHSRATIVAITFSLTGKKIEISYSDNGVGVSAEKIIYKNGLLNIEERIKAINGDVTIDTAAEKGFHITLTYSALKTYV